VKFGFSGDSDGRFRPYPLIAKIASQKLNYFIFLGHTMYETASAGSPEVPVISGLTTNAADLSSALTVYNEKYRNNVCGVNPDRSAEHLRPAESAVDAGCDRNLYSARQPRARQ